MSTTKKNTMDVLWNCFLFLLLCLSIFNISFFINSKPKILFAKTDDRDQKVKLWKAFTTEHPDYFEGYVELSKLELVKGNFEEAMKYYLIANSINPNSEKVIELKKRLANY